MDSVTKENIAELICGDDSSRHPVYRSSMYLTKFFQDIGIDVKHDGTTRKWWTLEVINKLNGYDLQKVILRLASPKLYGGSKEQIKIAISTLNEILSIEGLRVAINGLNPELEKDKPDFILNDVKLQEPELKPLPPPDFRRLKLENGIAEILAKRWDEIQVCIDCGATLSAVVMMGALLEGFLMGTMQQHPQVANRALNAPKKENKVKHFAEWTLNDMIEVAHEVGWIQLDVKKFSHALRDFRNLIHPYQQLMTNAYPDFDTCRISWLVVQAACNDIAKSIEVGN